MTPRRSTITRKSTELTKELVTDQLRKTFQDELTKLEFKHLAIEIQTAGGAKGALFHRLVFSNCPEFRLFDVLSEGESRTLVVGRVPDRTQYRTFSICNHLR